MTATPTRRTNIAFHVPDYERLEKICDATGYNKRQTVAAALVWFEKELQKQGVIDDDSGSRKRAGSAAT